MNQPALAHPVDGPTGIPPAVPASRAARLRPATGGGLFIIVVLVLTVGSVLVWRSMRTGNVPRYTTAAVTRGSITRTVTASGTVNPVLTITVGSYVSGVIQALYCDFNTPVKRGQLCAKIDPRPYQTIVDQDQANLAIAKAQLTKDQANLAYAKLTYERNRSLLERGLVTQDALDSAINGNDQAQAQIEFDQATIAQRQAELSAAQVNLGYTDILSPVDGVVVARNVTIGQTVAASFQTPTLFLIAADPTKMEVDTNVSESDIGAIKTGNTATFTVEAYPDQMFEGKVAQVRQAPQTVQNVVTYDVVINVDNSKLLLMPGMTATARIVAARHDSVLRVPDQALRFVPGGLSGAEPAAGTGTAHVWALRSGGPLEITVVTGLDDDTNTEIVSGGLSAGDPVILTEERARAISNSSAPRLKL